MTDVVKVLPGDCLSVLDSFDENSIDAVVTDPPYGIGFMGKHWDYSDNLVFRPDTWAKVLRVLKPGAHMFAFSACRTYHRMACAIEDAGFEIREMHAWVFSQGFPKSLDVSKAIDKAAGAEREIVGIRPDFAVRANKIRGEGQWREGKGFQNPYEIGTITAPATDAARDWQGWGTATKPAFEPIVLARKPLSEGTVAANVLRWGTGALNIDATRVATSDRVQESASGGVPFGCNYIPGTGRKYSNSGRWPANLAHDGSEDVLALFPQTKSGGVNGIRKGGPNNCMSGGNQPRVYVGGRGADEGSAARFFYCAKANAKDRIGSKHPTVKPVALMRWLVRMITPPGGTVLDPFAGTGTTGQAAIEEGFRAVLIEREEEYRADIERRLESVLA